MLRVLAEIAAAGFAAIGVGFAVTSATAHPRDMRTVALGLLGSFAAFFLALHVFDAR